MVLCYRNWIICLNMEVERMDHVWNDLKKWERIWEEQLEDEKNGSDHEYKEKNIELLTEQLKSIRKALSEIGRWI